MTEIRRLNLKKIEQAYGTQVLLAEIIELSPARVNHLLTGQRNIGEKAARKIEKLLNKPHGWMDLLDSESVINNTSIIDLSKYTEDQQRVIKMLLDSFDSTQSQENKQEKYLTTETIREGGGGADTFGQQWPAVDRRITRAVDRRIKATAHTIIAGQSYSSTTARYKQDKDK